MIDDGFIICILWFS